MPNVLSAEFPDRRAAERAMSDLEIAGFARDSMVLVPIERVPSNPSPTRAASNAISGSVIGLLVGAALGALAGWWLGDMIVGLHSRFLYTIIIVAIVGALLGWVTGGMLSSGVRMEEREYDRERVEQGRMILRVPAGPRDEVVRGILLRYGARNLTPAA